MPKVSIVILNWNGKKFLSDCLQSLRRVTYKPLEIIIVDNNSSDGSVDYVKRFFPEVKIFAKKENAGFAKGNNFGWKKATGEYVLFLNNDTVATPNFLAVLLSDLRNDPTIGCMQPEMRVLNKKELMDEAGAYLTFTGFSYHYGYRKTYALPMYRKMREIFSVKGACMLVPKKVLRETGGFDEDFFIFYEETDLCYRIWLRGYRVLYEPAATIYHLAGGDTMATYDQARRVYLTIRNMNRSFLKNFGLLNLFTIYPIFELVQLTLLISYLIKRKFSLAGAIVRANWWNILNLLSTVQQRYIIQSHRKISDYHLNKHIVVNPKWNYFFLPDVGKYKDVPIGV